SEAKDGVGDRTNDPGRNSLRLLPSGPDRVGEGPVRRRPPTPLYQGAAAPGQVSSYGRNAIRHGGRPLGKAVLDGPVAPVNTWKKGRRAPFQHPAPASPSLRRSGSTPI